MKKQGPNYLAVFKSILLLNAFNNLAANETVTPSEENIRNMYVGTPIDSEMDDILNWINTEGIVQRSPQGIFEIRFSALDAKEIEEFKKQLIDNDYKYTSQLLKFGNTAKMAFEKKFEKVNRPLSFDFFSEDINEYTLLNKIENGRKGAETYEVYLALMMARTNAELYTLKDVALKAMTEERFKDVAFLVFDTTLDPLEFDRFIIYQASAKCASKNGFTDQAKSHTDNAKAIIADWMRDLSSGTCTLYIQGDSTPLSTRTLANVINSIISPRIFSSGPESLEILRLKAPSTCWVKQFSNKTADTVLSFNTKDEITTRCVGPAKHIPLLLQDSVDDNLHFKQDVDPKHPLYLVAKFVKSKIDHSDKQLVFNLSEKFKELTMPPYGLFKSHAGYGMLAFAMRPYVDKVFDTNGKPINAQRMQEFIDDTFKIWDSGSGNIHKVDVKFETKEEGSIAKGLISMFQLGKLKEYTDATSLTDARWALRNGFCPQVGYPLWAIKYCDNIQTLNCKEKMVRLTDNIITIYTEVGAKNPALLAETDSLITELRYDYTPLLNYETENNFANGFRNFLMADTIVNLKEEDYDAALNYIQQHMEAVVGLWTESAVIEQLKDWKLSLMPTEPQPSPSTGGSTNNISVATGTAKDSDRMDKAKAKIQSISSIDEAKRILDAICNLGYDSILDIILK